jgi:hypothetical protein
LKGVAKYFNKNDNECTMFFGECPDNIPKGRGINIKCEMKKIDITQSKKSLRSTIT